MTLQTLYFSWMILSINRFAEILHLPKKDLLLLANNNSLYYHEFQMEEDNGKIRDITTSSGLLKEIQKTIKSKILDEIYLKHKYEFSIGGVKSFDNIKNAKLHQGKKYHYKTDLKNYFPSLTNKRIYHCLINDFSFSPAVSSIITKLTTYKGAVPQGLSTSMVLANMAFHTTDIELEQFCIDNKINLYTRFVDDLTFSSNTDFQKMGNQILGIIKNNGFLINYDKTEYTFRNTDITGIDVKNNCINPNSKIKDKILDDRNSEKRKEAINKYIDRIHKTNKSSKN